MGDSEVAVRTEHDAPVLIADANTSEREELKGVFVGAGYNVHDFATGEEALSAARERGPSVVLLEVPLPGICGYEVCRALRREFGPELPIVFVSGARTEPYDRVAGLLVGADDYVVKPYARDEVLARVRRLVNRAQPLAAGTASKLTRREQEILRLLAVGLKQSDIARRLFISPRTVGTH